MPNIERFNEGIEDKTKEEKYWNEGYNYPISAILRLINVSKSWLYSVLLKDIDYVTYAPNFAFKKSRAHCLAYVKEDEFKAWLLTHCTFQAQSEYVDLAYYLSPYKKVYTEAYKMYKEERRRYREQRGTSLKPGIIPEKVLNYINSELSVYNAEHNYSSQHRKGYKWVDIDRFDILNENIEFYNLKDACDAKGKQREMFYRAIFERGDIKVKLSNQIALFVKNKKDLSNYKMPFIIPYGKTIYITRKKDSK